MIKFSQYFLPPPTCNDQHLHSSLESYPCSPLRKYIDLHFLDFLPLECQLVCLLSLCPYVVYSQCTQVAVFPQNLHRPLLGAEDLFWLGITHWLRQSAPYAEVQLMYFWDSISDPFWSALFSFQVFPPSLHYQCKREWISLPCLLNPPHSGTVCFLAPFPVTAFNGNLISSLISCSIPFFEYYLGFAFCLYLEFCDDHIFF